jgi:hypothetical protein
LLEKLKPKWMGAEPALNRSAAAAVGTGGLHLLTVNGEAYAPCLH